MLIKANNDFLYTNGFRKVKAPRFKGELTVKLHNPTTGKTEIIEGHNAQTNALANIFSGNFGGLLNYQNFADLTDTWLGGVLLFQNALDPTTPNDYGIPARTTNPCIAHAGQVALTDQADDLTRGNPDSSQTVKTANSVKHVWEWISSAGNGTISSLGLCHSDVGSYGCGVASQAQKLLNPFADIGCLSREYEYGDNADAPMAINGNLAYSFYLSNNTTVKIYKAPINNSKFKLQGEALKPISDYAEVITATLPNSYNLEGKGGCYFHFDFTNGNLILFGVPTEGGTTLYKDVISLSDGTVTHSSITVTGANLWKFKYPAPLSGSLYFSVPVKAIVYDNHLYVFGYTDNGGYPNKIFRINLANTADITEVDTTGYNTFYNQNSTGRISERFAQLGGIIVHDSFLINGEKTFELVQKTSSPYAYSNYANENSVSSPVFGANINLNMISVNKLFLATKYSLPSSITKSSAQSMTVEYTLTEV